LRNQQNSTSFDFEFSVKKRASQFPASRTARPASLQLGKFKFLLHQIRAVKHPPTFTEKLRDLSKRSRPFDQEIAKAFVKTKIDLTLSSWPRLCRRVLPSRKFSVFLKNCGKVKFFPSRPKSRQSRKPRRSVFGENIFKIQTCPTLENKIRSRQILRIFLGI